MRFLTFLIQVLNQTLCIHDFHKQHAPGRIYLRCVNCQYETEGWRIERSDRNYIRGIHIGAHAD
jgi:hypothetical protein